MWAARSTMMPSYESARATTTSSHSMTNAPVGLDSMVKVTDMVGSWVAGGVVVRDGSLGGVAGPDHVLVERPLERLRRGGLDLDGQALDGVLPAVGAAQAVQRPDVGGQRVVAVVRHV